MAEHIHGDLIRIALSRVEGSSFERFAAAFFSALSGASFVPMGGVKDGGADARDGSIYEDSRRSEIYYQASIELDVEGKIRRTVRRLREFGREPKTLYYLTSQTVKYSDRVEMALSDELDVTITIRDAGYIAAHINDDPTGRALFNEHLRHYTDFLRSAGSSRIITSSKHVKDPTVYVFLSQELERRAGNEKLVNSVVDALALWALEGTDPDAGILYDYTTVLNKINSQLPSVQSLVAPRLQQRLEVMSKKQYAGGRAVNWYQKEGLFCLPYETRLRIEEENRSDEAMRLQVLGSFDDRLREVQLSGLGDVRRRQAADVALRTLQLAFERNGLEFSSFLHKSDAGEYSTISDSLLSALQEYGLAGRVGQLVGDAAFYVLRGVFYNSREQERLYLQRLSRTYALLFTLQTEPKLIDFFQQMTGEFRLYVGSDQLVRALSEHYLNEPDRMSRNTLLMAAQLGAKLILSEPVLEEVVNHLRVCDFEYRNHLIELDEYMNFELARNAPHIVLRTYLYARISSELGPRRPKTWPAFVNQFCRYEDLHRPAAFDDIRRYLQSKFSLMFESTEDLGRVVDMSQVEQVAEKLTPVKRGDLRLARNDALLALAVYGHRKRRKETSSFSEFGYATWWLTSETAILKHTRQFVAENRARYVMRPDFLLNFLTLSPSAAQVRETFKAVFPSLLGVRLARRMQAETFDEIMDAFTEAGQIDEARRTAEIARISDQLKSDFTRQYTLLGDSQVNGLDSIARQAEIDRCATQTLEMLRQEG